MSYSGSGRYSAMNRSCFGVLRPTQMMSGFHPIDGAEELSSSSAFVNFRNGGCVGTHYPYGGTRRFNECAQFLRDSVVAAVEEMRISARLRCARRPRASDRGRRCVPFSASPGSVPSIRWAFHPARPGAHSQIPAQGSDLAAPPSRHVPRRRTDVSTPCVCNCMASRSGPLAACRRRESQRPGRWRGAELRLALAKPVIGEHLVGGESMVESPRRPLPRQSGGNTATTY